MAQYDVHPQIGGPGFWLNCQTDLMSDFETRFVVPLIPIGMTSIPIASLNPVFSINDENHVMVTHLAATIMVQQLLPATASLAASRYKITNALDFLMTGV